jgi:hypothetical protein
MRWHINFSRIAMNGVDAPFFEFLTLYLALRGLRGRPAPLRAMAWLGLAVGLGLSFYTPYRLFVIAMAVFGLLLLWRRFGRSGGVRTLLKEPSALQKPEQITYQPLATSLGMFLLAVWLAAMPTTQYAWRHSQSFWARARHVSIFQNRDQPNLALALAENTGKHLLMFNYKGDNNGRHNLPGAPMLDRLSAILFALGLGLAVARRRHADMFFLVLLPAGLLGGILTLDFEAPQSLRSMAALPAVIYFVAASLDALWFELRWAAHIQRPRYSLGLAFLGLGAIAFGNGFTYFGPQAHDETVWRAFSTTETLVGKTIAELGSEPVYYTSPFFYDHVTVQFHAPVTSSRSERKVMPLPDPLPAREPPDRPVVYFIHPDEEWVFDLARQIYPNGQFEILPSDKDYEPAVYVVYLDPGQVASVQGIEVRYWAGDSWDSIPRQFTRTPRVDAAWPDDASLPLPFMVEWRGVLYTPHYGQYRLGIEAPGEAELSLDGKVVQGSGEIDLVEQLAVGNHDLRLRAEGGPGHIRLWWQPPQGKNEETVPAWALYSFPITANGLLGKYYPNSKWEGVPSLERIDPILDLYFHLTPLPRPYSVEWTGMLHIPESGVYGLGLRAVDEARLYLDDELIVDATSPDLYTEKVLALEAGLHKLRITYQDLTGRSRIHLYWSPLGRPAEIIPREYLYPAQNASQLSQLPAAPAPTRELPSLNLKWQATWGGPGQEAGQFLEPRDVAVIGDTVFIADTGNRRVQAFKRDGTFLDAWSGAEEGFEEPLALGVDNRNRLLVLDSPTGWIYRFDANGRTLDRAGGPAIQAYHPRGMTVLGDKVIISDTGGGRILFLDSDGRIEGQIGGVGQTLIQFEEPTDVAMDKNGIYYIAEAYAQRLQRIDGQGRALNQWPIPPSIAHDGPHLAWGPEGSLLMSAPEEGAILRYAPDGRLLGRWTQAGPGVMCRPVGVFVDDAARTLYVTDTICHQVYLFKL